ncbi:uncharacterized protein OCT59_012974 [Rhizophagus irregularis]|uniref:Reverse transcriptase domain-containing protein n=1 Tax=Rhizophagus irregularis (strain DAOM 197198w) TaxID=1432141 RepID=A0A015JA86_RHIIW|nr:hypothetical protein RirG_148980 [Rhizophagus irregularis DAOM 197198w]UZO20551.1 hypothetical protein OCT59_012974 [Rhizophagus irregularis]
MTFWYIGKIFTTCHQQIIQQEWWDDLTIPNTLDDLHLIFKKLNPHKAPGPSKIKYEDLIHLHDDALKILVRIFNACITLQLLPKKWRNVLLFPIPKPHDWNSKLHNTRPITLLETPRKLLVNIISTKLNNILSQYSILQDNNKAGILEQSTLEPLMSYGNSTCLLNTHVSIKNHYRSYSRIYQRHMTESIFKFLN